MWMEFSVVFFFFKQKTAYEITVWLEFRRVLFRSEIFHRCVALGLETTEIPFDAWSHLHVKWLACIIGVFVLILTCFKTCRHGNGINISYVRVPLHPQQLRISVLSYRSVVERSVVGGVQRGRDEYRREKVEWGVGAGIDAKLLTVVCDQSYWYTFIIR